MFDHQCFTLWPQPHAAVVGVFCHLTMQTEPVQFVTSSTGGRVVVAEFLSVLLLKQILSAFCQISRHVSAVISTPRSFSHICLVACVITQVVAGNQCRLIF